MAIKPDADRPLAEVAARKTSEQPLIINEMGSVSEDTHGAPGFHTEFGFPPFNQHP